MAAASGKGPSKGEILVSIAEETGLTREAGRSGDGIARHADRQEREERPGNVHGSRPDEDHDQEQAGHQGCKGIDPFTKEERMFKAKPASRQVGIKALKNLKDMAM